MIASDLLIGGYNLEEEIDLRPYVEAIVKRWYWVVGTAVLAGVVAFIISSLLPPTYEATALVVVTEPSQLVRFEAGFDAIQEIVPRPLRAYPELSLSDELLQTVLTEVQPVLAKEMTLDQLRGTLSAESGGDPSLIRLIVQYSNPETTALIANTWAKWFVQKANEIYGSTNDNQLASFEAQVKQISGELEEAGAALIEFQARNRLDIVSNELFALQTTRSTLLAKRVTVNLLLQDIAGLIELLSAQSGNSVNLADQLTALFLQVSAFYEPAQGSSNPVFLQINGDAAVLTTASRREQIALLNDLETTLITRLAKLDNEVDMLEPQILLLQTEREVFVVEQNQLNRERDTAQEAYLALARRVEEERITAQDVTEGVRLASQAAVPKNPMGSRRLLITMGGIVLQGFLAVTVILFMTWWRIYKAQELTA